MISLKKVAFCDVLYAILSWLKHTSTTDFCSSDACIFLRTKRCPSFRRTVTYSYSHWPWPWFNRRPSGCIEPHFDAILICFELPPLLPPRWFPSLTSPCWRCSSSLHADDLDLDPEPPSATPVEVYAGDPFVSHVQANGVFFHWVCHPCYVVQFW